MGKLTYGAYEKVRKRWPNPRWELHQHWGTHKDVTLPRVWGTGNVVVLRNGPRPQIEVKVSYDPATEPAIA